jgi:hypothetical protein
VKKNTIYSIFLILGLLCFFFVKSKFSTQSEYSCHCHKYSYQTKSSKSPIDSSCLINLIEEQEEDNNHCASINKIISFIYTLPYTLDSNFKLNHFKVNNDVTHIYMGIPTFIVIRNFRI